MRTLLLLAVIAACRQTEPSPEELAAKLEGAKPGEERQVGQGAYMTMYLTQAQSPLDFGWNLARSTKGAFSVEVPLPYNDFRVRSAAEDGVEITADSVGGKTPGKLSWMASCIRRADGTVKAPVTDKTETLGDPVRAWQRTIPIRGGQCLLIVEAQGNQPLPPEADIQRFLRSFKPAP